MKVGTDYVCHIHGGVWHVGAVALSQWRDDRAETACLTVGTHKEGAIAVNAASALCSVTGRSAACIAGIHFGGITPDEVRDISRAADELTVRVVRHLTQGRWPTTY